MHPIIQAEVDEFEKEFPHEETCGISMGYKEHCFCELDRNKVIARFSAALHRAVEKAGKEILPKKIQNFGVPIDYYGEDYDVFVKENNKYCEDFRSLALSKLDTIINFKE